MPFARCVQLLFFGLAFFFSPCFASNLTQGITLYNNNETSKAAEILKHVGRTSPDRAQALAYRALCDYRWQRDNVYLKDVDAIGSRTASLPADLRQTLLANYLRAALRQKNWEAINTQVPAFEQDFSASPALPEIKQIHTIALYERGIKKARETARLGDKKKLEARRQAAQADLTAFVALARGHARLEVDPSRDVSGDLLRAAQALDDAKLIVEFSAARPATEVILENIRSEMRLHPDNVDQHLKSLRDFAAAGATPSQLNEVKFKLASTLCQRGKALLKQANQLDKAGSAAAARTARAEAQQFFSEFQVLQPQIHADPAGGIEPTDIVDLQDDLLSSLGQAGDTPAMLKAADELTSSSRPHTPSWALGRLYRGMGLFQHGMHAEAARALDDALSLGLTGKSETDRIYLTAALWRIGAAKLLNDTKTVASLEERINKPRFKQMLSEVKAETLP